MIITCISTVITLYTLVKIVDLKEQVNNLNESIDGIKNKVARKPYYNKNKRPGNQS